MINRTKVYQKYSGHCAYCGKNIEITEMQLEIKILELKNAQKFIYPEHWMNG